MDERSINYYDELDRWLDEVEAIYGRVLPEWVDMWDYVIPFEEGRSPQWMVEWLSRELDWDETDMYGLPDTGLD